MKLTRLSITILLCFIFNANVLAMPFNDCAKIKLAYAASRVNKHHFILRLHLLNNLAFKDIWAMYRLEGHTMVQQRMVAEKNGNYHTGKIVVLPKQALHYSFAYAFNQTVCQTGDITFKP